MRNSDLTIHQNFFWMTNFEIMGDKRADRFVNGKMEFPDCNKCKHYNRDVTCKIFPLGIPYEILEGKSCPDYLDKIL